MVAFKSGLIKCISLDITGTLFSYREPIAETYARCALEARLPAAPSAAELKPAFKAAYKEACVARPCFGGPESDEREWWRFLLRRTLALSGREPAERDFDRYFRRVYQHYGSPAAYAELPDARPALEALRGSGYVLGITSNTPRRVTDSALPMLGLAGYFDFYACCQDVGVEKPDGRLFQAALEDARFWRPDLQPENVLHVGDSFEADLCGARAAGFQALLLDRSDVPTVVKYQDWLAAPDYPGKSEADIESSTITSLRQVTEALGLAS